MAVSIHLKAQFIAFYFTTQMICKYLFFHCKAWWELKKEMEEYDFGAEMGGECLGWGWHISGALLPVNTSFQPLQLHSMHLSSHFFMSTTNKWSNQTTPCEIRSYWFIFAIKQFVHHKNYECRSHCVCSST